MSAGEEVTTPKKILERSLIWFVLGVIVTAIGSTIAAQSYLDEFVKNRIQDPRINEALQRPTPMSENQVVDIVKGNIPSSSGIDSETVAAMIEEALQPYGPFKDMKGAVVAFDLPAGCPLGWTDMGGEFRGRSIVGAIENADDAYGFRRTGGTETHQLSIEEMPRHSHGYTRETEFGTKNRPSVSGQRGITFVGLGNDRTTEAGGSQPHNNMPPFVALYLCRKE